MSFLALRGGIKNITAKRLGWIKSQLVFIAGFFIFLNHFFWFVYKKYPNQLAIGLISGLLFFSCLPKPMFNDPLSIVLEDRDGNLLGARIATDGQWRFPYTKTIPEKYRISLIMFEDRRFLLHHGIDFISIGRAVFQNFTQRRIVSGGSTITMQVMRLSEGKGSRNLVNKLKEAIQATRMELTYSKNEILSLYAANAPFGGNVVGLEAASWRYFGKAPDKLSWAEAATFAVLPNSPALIHPGRNRNALLNKRNRLLNMLREAGYIDDETGELSKEEPLPDAPLPLPQLAPHLLDRAAREAFSDHTALTRLRTTIDARLQTHINELAENYHRRFSGNGIHNLAILVMDIERGEVLAYIGNAPAAGKEHGESVDIIRARRSSGSLLKPFLYGYMLQEGQLLPTAMVQDIPSDMSGYHPENYLETYDGVIPANQALKRSLNIPFIKLLQQYGVEKFHYRLQKSGFSTIDKSPDYYGLPLILGGGEITLWDITSAYACLSRVLGHYYKYEGSYDPLDYRSPCYVYGEAVPATLPLFRSKETNRMQAGAIWSTFEAMKKLERPDAEGNWEIYQSAKSIAWKTGTSFGFRDAWAVGVDPGYAVGVWVGNADGEGRPGLIGYEAAAPILFDVFKLLKSKKWFDQPFDDMKKVSVCAVSGFKATGLCPRDTVWAPKAGIAFDDCPYHRMIHLDQQQLWQVNADCASGDNMVSKAWFILPPVEEFFYKPRHPSYITPPPFREDCLTGSMGIENVPFELIYPRPNARIYVPLDLNGQLSNTVFKVAHRVPETTIYWHIDNEYQGETSNFHELNIAPSVGKHTLTVVDEKGYRVELRFEILNKPD